MPRTDRPLSRRAFFKTAGLAGAAAALPAGSAVAEKSDGGLKYGEKRAVEDKALDDDLDASKVSDYIDLVDDLWGYFLRGAQGMKPKDGLYVTAYEFPDKNSDEGKIDLPSGTRLTKTLGDFEPGNDVTFNTRYCCYVCGFFAAREARSAGASEIRPDDYKAGWRAAKARWDAIKNKAKTKAGSSNIIGGACT